VKPSIDDLIKDLFRSLAQALKDLKGMVRDLSGNPLVLRTLEDIKNVFKNLAASTISLFSGLKRPSIKREAAASGGENVFPYIISGLVLGVVLISVLFSAVFFQVSNRWDRNYYTVNILPGYGAVAVADLLLEKGIIDNRYSFNTLVSIFKIENRIQSGTYSLSPSMGIGSIVLKLKNGEVIAPALKKLVLPEGTSIYKVGVLLRNSGIGNGEEFEGLMKDAISEDLRTKFAFLKGAKTDSLEGYLFPDTYFVPDDVPTAILRDLMLSRFSSVVMPFWERSTDDTLMTLHEILTLASIIEKEAQVDEERPVISSVFHNRLKKKMHLAADPTVKYALSEFRKPTKKVYYIDLEIDSPYNTYRRLGLPPGPICNPGLSSIKAAVYPAKTTYLYFVARRDGTHIFSTTWQEHEKAKLLVRGE
jgi:UPF0755 protein